MTSVVVLNRVFRFGATTLPDPAPQLSPMDAVRLYAPTYPHLENCTLQDVGQEGDSYVYQVVKPPVQTKGSKADDDFGNAPRSFTVACLVGVDARSPTDAARAFAASFADGRSVAFHVQDPDNPNQLLMVDSVSGAVIESEVDEVDVVVGDILACVVRKGPDFALEGSVRRALENALAAGYYVRALDSGAGDAVAEPLPDDPFDRLADAITDEDGLYGRGFRDAVESLCLALKCTSMSTQPGFDLAVREALETTMDAYANHADGD
ncbi:MAG: PRTRC system protein C [Rhodanobacter sp.]